MALAPLVSAALSPRRRNISKDGEISPCNGTTTTSPLWITSRALAVAGVIRAITAAIANTLTPTLSLRGRGGLFSPIGEKARMRGSAKYFVILPVDGSKMGKFLLMVWIASRAGLV